MSTEITPGASLSVERIAELEEQIKQKGDQIRQLKADGTEKADLAPHIAELKALKAELDPPKEKKAPQKKQTNNAPNNKKKPAAAEELSDSELKAARLSKVDAMREAGVEPYEYTFQITQTASQLASAYENKLEPGEEDEASDVSIAGRIMARRVFGKLAFYTIQDESGTIQLQLDKTRLEGDSFKVRNSFNFHVLHALSNRFYVEGI
jgi:lysyl-tRNA synthetase class 2